MRLDDPAAVAAQYATEDNLEARRSLYRNAHGPDPRELAVAAVAEAAPARVLEVGGGPGELSARIQADLAAEVVMIDISPRMVQLARERGVDARVGDAQALPFPDGFFDCAVAAWMLYHVPDIELGLAELARILRPGGRLVAVTNALAHMRELRAIAGSAAWHRPFTRENAGDALRRHFARVERRDADGWTTVESREAVEAYVASLGEPNVKLSPFTVPLRATCATSVFVAETA